MAVIETQAEADRLNASGEYGPYHAANGHTMVAPLVFPSLRAEGQDGERDYRVGDQIRYTSWNAWCTATCYACRNGDPLPDW